MEVFNQPHMTTVLAIRDFEIVTINDEHFAYIQADVEQLVNTYYSEPEFAPCLLEARVLLSDDTDLVALANNVEEQWELAEDVTDWDYAEPSDYDLVTSNSCGTAWHDGCR